MENLRTGLIMMLYFAKLADGVVVPQKDDGRTDPTELKSSIYTLTFVE